MRLKYTLIQKGTPFIPSRLRALIRRHLSLKEYDYMRLRSENPFVNKDKGCYADSPVKIGIIEDVSQYHKHYIAACREMEISYQVFDLTSPDWVNKFSKSDCDAFLVWPSISNTALKAMFDSRLRILEEEMDKLLYPTAKECWLYEHKPRTLDWMNVHNIPHPQSWVFYNEAHALEFSSNTKLPIVVKTATGASASGVQIVKSVQSLRKIIKQAFTKGITPRGYHPHDRQWGSVYLQEYLPNVKEWRMVRIGKSYFGHRKGKIGDFHSGSGEVLWDNPPENLLSFLLYVTDVGNFTSMNVDVFETVNGQYLVNELQTVFGASYSKDQLRVNGKAGRYIYNKSNKNWEFEEGNFALNACANLRLQYLIKILSQSNKKTMS